MRKSPLLVLTAVAALGSSFLVPADAFASSRGFAHAAHVSRSAHTSIGFQRPASSRTVARGSFTQHRFGSANTAVGRAPSFASRFSMGNRTFGHTPQLDTLASNSHALTGPQAANGHAEKNTQTPSNAEVIALTNRASADTSKASKDFNRARFFNSLASNDEKAAQQERRDGDRLGAIKEDRVAANDRAKAEDRTKAGDKDLKAAEIDTTEANGLANKANDKTGTGGKTGSGDKTGTGDKKGGGGSTTNTNNTQTGGGGNTNASNTPGGGNQPHPGLGGRPFPGQFPGTIGMGHGPFVGGPFVGGQVAVGGTIAPVAIAPVASTGGALPPVTAPSAPRPLAPSCLKKTYLQTGVVMFRDVCSQEWAIGNSSITNPAPTHSACLSKENPQEGVVLFKDNCTSEWAMNPQQPDNQAQAN
jgi:hypothetical protein